MPRHDNGSMWLLAILALAGGAAAVAPPQPRRPVTFPPGPVPGDAHLTLAELNALALSVGFPNPAIAAAIAMAESSGFPHAQGDPRGPFLAVPNGVSTSFGLWQIHAPAHPEFDRIDLLTPEYNAHAALLVSKGGTDFTPWSTFNKGPHGEPPAYLQYMGSQA